MGYILSEYDTRNSTDTAPGNYKFEYVAVADKISHVSQPGTLIDRVVIISPGNAFINIGFTVDGTELVDQFQVLEAEETVISIGYYTEAGKEIVFNQLIPGTKIIVFNY